MEEGSNGGRKEGRRDGYKARFSLNIGYEIWDGIRVIDKEEGSCIRRRALELHRVCF